MKICVATFGSDGDVQPYLALAKALSEAGYDILFHTMDRYKPRVEKLGLKFHLLNEWDATTSQELGAKMLSTRNPANHIRYLYDAVEPEFLQSLPRSIDAVSQCDVVINHVITASVTAAAIKQKKPLICGHLFPNIIPSKKLDPFGNAGNPISNRVIWWMLKMMMRRYTDPSINRVFAAAGLPYVPDQMIKGLHSPLLNVVAMSPRLLPKETGWPAHYITTGYWFLDEPDYTPEPALSQFLNAGEPPILITFGSMSGMDVAKQNQILIEGVKRAGKRVIFQSGWAGIGEGDLPSYAFKAGVIPHSWLLHKVSGIIHHGGAGTTSASFRAGIPQAIVWHLGDQSTWGNMTRSLGLGLPPIWYKNLTPSWVEKAITQLSTNETLRQHAKSLGEEIRKENGLQNAIQAIQSVLAKI